MNGWEHVLLWIVAWSIVHILWRLLGWLVQLHDGFCRDYNLPYLL